MKLNYFNVIPKLFLLCFKKLLKKYYIPFITYDNYESLYFDAHKKDIDHKNKTNIGRRHNCLVNNIYTYKL